MSEESQPPSRDEGPSPGEVATALVLVFAVVGIAWFVSSRSSAPPPASFTPLPPRRVPAIPETFGGEPPPGMRRGAEPGVFLHDTKKGVEIEMLYVPPGEFIMGADDPDAYPDEKPRHSVRVEKGFWIGRRPVLWREFRAFEESVGRAESARLRLPDAPTRPDCAVSFTTFADALGFCEWAGLRLPTEVEWERAARGTDGRKFPWGDEAPAPDLCVFCDHPAFGVSPGSRAQRAVAPAGSFPAGMSPVGALDMAGNVFQWCADLYDENAYERHARGDLSPPSSGKERVIRGGAWTKPARVLRCSNREHLDPALAGPDLGFRVAR